MLPPTLACPIHPCLFDPVCPHRRCTWRTVVSTLQLQCCLSSPSLPTVACRACSCSIWAARGGGHTLRSNAARCMPTEDWILQYVKAHNLHTCKTHHALHSECMVSIWPGQDQGHGQLYALCPEIHTAGTSYTKATFVDCIAWARGIAGFLAITRQPTEPTFGMLKS